MAKFNWKAKPTDDPKWRGGHRHYWNLWNTTHYIIIPFVVLLVVENYLLRGWLSDERYGHPFSSVDQFWWRIGLALLPDAAITFIQTWGLCTQHWHPITALVSSVALCALWFTVAFLNPFVAYNNEYRFENDETWEKLCYAEAGFQAVISLLYAVMAGFAAKGIHVWRKSRGAKYMNVEMNAQKTTSSFEYSHDATARV
ncbi:hypothetical protein DM02DRAFT_611463 [Periconia macrospinosa]|uniref:Uncharacterized protein n=1 Tax=Periconia macrospinosa TaxID=97972 RepID=A0A2V1E1N2_9PLEO|nr:hypothetical protein DM02DRAFT_611463 [Periconia macrospinosa]